MELIEKLKTANEIQKEFLLFKYFIDIEQYGYSNNEVDDYILNNYDYNKIKYLKIMSKALLSNTLNIHLTDNRIEFSASYSKYYNNILDNWINLSQKLNLNSSLELSNLFTYLLWNGYFSKDKKQSFEIENRTILEGFFSLSIMNGTGVCLNYSEMLRDFLFKAGIKSTMIINYISSDIENNSIASELIKRPVVKPTKKTMFNYLLCLPIVKTTGNHACTLIEENDKLYIYDPTNLVCAEIKDYNKAVVIDGEGSFDLKPCFSYAIVRYDFEKKIIEDLTTKNQIESPYTKEDIMNSWIKCSKIFEDNIDLIEKCYYETREDILKICNNLDEYSERIENNKVKIKKLVK